VVVHASHALDTWLNVVPEGQVVHVPVRLMVQQLPDRVTVMQLGVWPPDWSNLQPVGFTDATVQAPSAGQL
jgi:hypothetical protein